MDTEYISINDEKNALQNADLGANSEQTLKKGKFLMWFELMWLKT
jgi:hypothetical protein